MLIKTDQSNWAPEIPFKMKIRTRQTHASLVLEYNTDCKNSKYNTLKEDQQQAPNEPFTTLCVIWSRAALMLHSRAFTLTSYNTTSIKSNDSRSAVPNWLKWFALRGPELTQMIRAPRSRTDSNDSRSAVPNWLKWFALRGPELNQMIRDSWFAVPNWIKWFALRGPELNQMIRAPRSRTESNDLRFAVPNWIKWFGLEH